MTGWDEYQTSVARVISVNPDAGTALVELDGGKVTAWLPDHLWLGTGSGLAVSAGSVVTLLRIIGGYQVVSAFTGASGGGAPTLGPELLANGNFESGVEGTRPTGWSSLWNYATGEPQPWAITLDAPLEGLQSARCTVLPDYSHSSVLHRTVASRIDPGLTYNFSGFASGAIATGTAVAALEVITGASDAEAMYFGGGTLQVVATLTDPGGAWPPLGGDFTVPAGHTYIRAAARVTSGGSPGTSAVVRFDSLSLKQRLA